MTTPAKPKTDRDLLREVFEYVRHEDRCEKITTGDWYNIRPCNCGLAELGKEVAQRLKEPEEEHAEADTNRLDWLEQFGIERCVSIQSNAPSGLIAHWYWWIHGQGKGYVSNGGKHNATLREAIDQALAPKP